MDLKFFPHHLGIWEGTYTRLAPDGSIMFKHKSRLTFRMDGKKWYQTNLYNFDDGREEFHNFGEAIFDDNGVMTFDNPRIYGKAWEGDKNIMLEWTYKDQPGSRLFEMITLINPGHRMRVWQFSQDDEFQGLMMIEEWQIAKEEEVDPVHFQTKSYIKEAV